MASKKTNSKDVQLAVMANNIIHIKERVDKIDDKLEEDYITRIEFEPVKKIVYGLVALILVAVVGAIIGLVIIG